MTIGEASLANLDFPAPYQMGDLVAVKVHSLFAGENKWVPGIVTFTAHRPTGIDSDRWAFKVCVGRVGDAPLEARAYCNDDGSSETVKPLNESML